jgi:signal peptidase I
LRKTKAPPGMIRRLAKNWAVPFGCGLLFLFLLKFVFFFGYVPSASMEPTIREGSFIFGVRVYEDLRRGDVIVFEHAGRLLVKRVAGVPGDTVNVIDGDTLTVPEDSFFMAGDNPADSCDSRYWDEPFVEQKDVVAVIAEIWQ